MQKNNTERGSMTKERKITLNSDKRKVIFNFGLLEHLIVIQEILKLMKTL